METQSDSGIEYRNSRGSRLRVNMSCGIDQNGNYTVEIANTTPQFYFIVSRAWHQKAYQLLLKRPPNQLLERD